MIRVAVIGLGVMGRQHVRILSELLDVELVAVCDSSAEARRNVERALDVPTIADWTELLDGEVDAVVNALPTPAHYETTKTLLEAQKHVLVEKPISTTMAEATALVSLAERSDRLLMVGHVERFNPVIQGVKTVIESGSLGEIVSMSARRVGVARPTAPQTDVVTDLAIHDIDLCGYLLPNVQGRLVFAAGTTLGANQLEDHADVVLRFGRAVAIVQANWITPVKIRRLTVTGTTGFADVDYLTQSLRVYHGAPELFAGPIWNFFAVAQESEPEEIPLTRGEPLRAELEYFVSRLQSGDHSTVGARQAAQALSLAIEATEVIRGRGR